MVKRISIVVLIVISIVSIFSCKSVTVTGDSNRSRHIVTDLMGRNVSVYDNAKHIAAIAGPTYEMTFMLGSAENVAMVKSGHTKNYPVAILTNPNLANLAGIAANPSSSVNIEDYLKNDIDLVLYYDNDLEMKKFDAVDIPAICISKNTGLLDTLEEVQNLTVDKYIDVLTHPLAILRDALGTETAKIKYEKWKKYCDEKIRYVYNKTKDLKDEYRPYVYWGNTWGEDIRTSYPRKNRYYEVQLAGGTMIGTDENLNFPEITAEQLFDWDPDIILVDNHGNRPDLVIKSMKKENSKWSTLQAVKNDELHRIPAGVFFIDKGSTTTLLVLWMAKIIHPELFKDLDLIEEIKYYFENFYDYKLNDEEANNVLNGWIING